jgi:cytochrome c biogenesis protein CcdA/thiol-disulfide isomerase/thioredoxin
MLIFLLAYLGGVLTILSPCVLPVLPFVFARSEQSFRRSGLPILLGMAVTFTVLASLAALGGAWLVAVNQYGRYAAMLLLLLLGLALIFPSWSERMMRPFVLLGGRLQQKADQQSSIRGSLLLGVAVGFLWAPCAGPILGLVLAGAALNGANLYSAMLLLTFALGAATSLAVALLASGRVIAWMKRSFGIEEWVRRVLGVAVVAGIVVIAFGWDTRFLARFTSTNTTAAEQQLISRLTQHANTNFVVADADRAPPLNGATQWLNSPPLNGNSLRGKVVLVDFWTYSCINCLRTLPYLKAWDERYRSQGLVIVGVHAPEFAFEKNISNVERAVRELGIKYPVAIDNQYAIWNAYKNEYWPAHYLIDAQGRIRHEHFGEGAYQETELMIQTLLKEAHQNMAVDKGFVQVHGTGATAAAPDTERSPETYLGYARQQNFASREALKIENAARYSAPRVLKLNQWALSGTWQVTGELAALEKQGGAISFRFRGRDLHLVMGTASGKPLHFKVTLDGAAPGKDHGADIDAAGNGVLGEQRLYQLVRQRGDVRDRTFRIEFQDAGAEAFAFTFG